MQIKVVIRTTIKTRTFPPNIKQLPMTRIFKTVSAPIGLTDRLDCLNPRFPLSLIGKGVALSTLKSSWLKVMQKLKGNSDGK
jgi:hypothetical protein